MLRLASHLAHLLAEAALGLLAVAALAVGILAWRLGEGPIDVTALVQREHAAFNARGARLTVQRARLAWEGFAHAGQPLDVLVDGVAAATDDGHLRVELHSAAVGLEVPQLLQGQLAPRRITVDGAGILLVRRPDDPLPGGGAPAKPGGAGLPPWLRLLQTVHVHAARLVLRGVLPGKDVVVPQADLDVARHGQDGFAGTARLVLEAGAARGTLDAQAVLSGAGTRLTATASPVSPAALAGLAPGLAGLAAVDAPVGLALQAQFGAGFHLQSARLDVAAGAGTLAAGSGSVALASLAAVVTARPGGLRVESLRLAMAPVAAGTHGPPPVITGTAAATRDAGKVHAAFTVAIDGVAMADLPLYWPEGAGGGTRPWLARNVTAGRATGAQVAGTVDGPGDLSDLKLTALTGGLLADDLSLTWLRPVPGLTHARARVVVEGPDALTVTMDRGGQNNLVLAPGSSIRITGLSARHQFGDIAVGLSGPLPDALGLLNHPRLHLLDRSGMQIVGAAGSVTAHLTLHVPLEDSVTMDQIPIAATASLSGVHLGRIAAGRDLDDANLALKVTGDGLTASGTGAVSGIPARLGLAMDFRAGKPSQVLQHVTAAGSATPAQLSHAGLPAGAVHLMTGGQAALRVDYAGLRDGTAALLLDADLGQAALSTPVGWSKRVGQPAVIGARVTLNHGRLAGVDHLHAEGPGLAIVSRSRTVGQARVLLLDRLEVGATRAHGEIGFPAGPAAPVRVDLSGPMLDLSSQLDAPAAPASAPPPPPPPDKAGPEKPGQAWSARLAFAQIRLAHGTVLAPFSLDAASNGQRILHAAAHAGGPGVLAVDITRRPGGRALAVAAADAGAALRALGVADTLAGGRLEVTGQYDDTRAGAPLSGTATLSDFNLRNAPGIGRLLQAMTLYGVADVMHGPGLHFSRLIAPFRWQDRVLALTSARAFSPSLGITAQGTLDLRRRVADVTGTVVPAYFFNQLLGDLPLIGKLFSPEKGGGVFAARYSVRGPLDDPKVGVNPLSALTPGFLREGFGLFAPAHR